MRPEPGFDLLGAAAPMQVEVCWTEVKTLCVLHPAHCWHVQLVAGLGQPHVIAGARSCCWCGVRQTAHRAEGRDQHGPFGPAALSLLDLAIESTQG
jgi:hypothetical protein